MFKCRLRIPHSDVHCLLTGYDLGCGCVYRLRVGQRAERQTAVQLDHLQGVLEALVKRIIAEFR